jgi:hypothetical protein
MSDFSIQCQVNTKQQPCRLLVSCVQLVLTHSFFSQSPVIHTQGARAAIYSQGQDLQEKRLKTVSCSDFSETFKQILVCIQSDFPSADCEVRLEGDEYAVHTPFRFAEATVVYLLTDWWTFQQ